jgi:Na+-translocating ferredoxin:NAD+ oxidoreductase RnfG subunit
VSHLARRATRCGARRNVTSLGLVLGLAAAACVLPASSERALATVFHSRDEALRIAFPDADRIEPRDFFLTVEQRQEIERRAQAPVATDLVTIYVGHKNGSIAGYAILDTHTVRTLPETFLVVLTPEGTVAATHVLAFYEPLEYSPSDHWLAQFNGKDVNSDLRPGRGIAAITGSTLTSHAVSAGIARALALHAVLIGGR